MPKGATVINKQLNTFLNMKGVIVETQDEHLLHANPHFIHRIHKAVDVHVIDNDLVACGIAAIEPWILYQ
jgi:hypothetical protein